MSNPLGRLKKSELLDRGFVPGFDGETEGKNPPLGSLVQEIGSRLTFVADGKGQWFSQNDNLGAKLDAIQAAAEAQLDEQKRTNQFLAVIADALTGAI